jgi:lipopolysaccharide transport system permease protein
LATPLASTLALLVDFFIAFVVLLLMMAGYAIAGDRLELGPGIALLPLFVILATTTCLGAGLWLSSLNVLYRDIRYTIPFISQLWLLASPVAYSSSLVPERWRAVYALNPMVGVIEGFRWALLGTAPPAPVMVLVSAAVSLALLIGGAYYFRRVERSFADLI